jgi:hypothetical protein
MTKNVVSFILSLMILMEKGGFSSSLLRCAIELHSLMHYLRYLVSNER